MCGFVATADRTIDITEALLRIGHRGIRTRVAETKFGKMGHVRLPIVGVGAENDQPVQRGPWTIAFVGEILDFRDREPDLECDLQVVTRGWVKKGARALTSRDGFWSVAALDDRDGSLHLLCDYLAQKPTYYRTDVMAGASELDSLACLAPVTADEIYLSAAIKWGYCPDAARTPYREVRRVLPGEHVQIFAPGRVHCEVVDRLLPEAWPLEEEIERAVKRRVLAADVPVAALVSGGLDSAIVFTLAQRHGDVRPYYVSDRIAKYVSETTERLAVSAVVGDAPVVEAQWSEVSPAFALLVMQEPIDLGSLIPQVALSSAVKERVCLTGDGADELFGGYGRAQRYDSQGSDVFHELVCWHLPRLDRVMMRRKVEVRSPFLARRVVQAALALPRGQRIGKKILKDLYRDQLPPGIADQPKVPLRTVEVTGDREAVSQRMVAMFRDMKWGSQQGMRAVG